MFNRLAGKFFSPSRNIQRRPTKDARLTFHSLEDRRLLATLIVNSAADNIISGDGLVTLREAILAANNDTVTDLGLSGVGTDTIFFADNVFGDPNTITLTIPIPLEITEALTIDATALANNVTIDADGSPRIFSITAATGDFTLAGLTLTGGQTTGDNSDIFDSTFSGGAVRSLTTGSLTIDQSTIYGNSTAGNYAHGGGIYAKGDVVVTGSNILFNSTTGTGADGGGIFSRGAVTLTSSTVNGNSTEGSGAYGGGISALGAVTLIDSTVSGNGTTGNSADGGGIDSQGPVTLMHSTITDNHTNASGGGIWNNNDTITITHSILAGNTAGGGSPDIRPGTGIFTVNFSLIGDNAGTGLAEAQAPDASGNLIGSAAGAGIIDPLLSPLANNGGPTQTHALLAGSLAIDAGDPSILFNAAEFDQRGAPFVRVGDDLAAPGFRIDIGAYERQTLDPSFFVVTTTVDELIYSNAGVSLREAISSANGSMGDDTITFDAALSGDTITLDGPYLEISEALTIDATALSNHVTIDGNEQSQIFRITSPTGDFTFAGLKLTGGKANLGFGGGAIGSLTTGSLTIDQSTISGNSSSRSGGGISSSGAVTLTDSSLNGNSSESTGGGIDSLGPVTFTSSTVSGNSATSSGGGINSSGDVTLTSSTVSGNSSTSSAVFSGGGGINSRGNVTLTSSTVTDNHANKYGGGIRQGTGSSFSVAITNSIVAGNTADSGSPDIVPGAGIFAVDFSLLGTAVTPDAGGSGNLFNDTPLLGPLGNNGGRTETHTPLTGSPAIDAGDPGVQFDPAEFDQRGAPFVRVIDGDMVGGARIDIGAHERQSVAGLSLVVDTVVDEGDGDFSAGDLSLREAIALANGSLGADTITFNATVFATPQTMLLTNGEIEINEGVTIDGPGQQLLIIDAQQQSRIFNVTATTGDFTLAGLTLTGGRTTGDNGFLATTFSGGAIRSLTTGNLTIDQSTVSGNSTAGVLAGGGGIFSTGGVTLTSSNVSGNSTTGGGADGGGIFSSGGVTLTSSTVSGNSTTSTYAAGGGIYSFGGVTLISSTVSGNSTAGSGGAFGGAGGGGIASYGGVTLTNSTVSGNSTAGNNNARGGGIFSTGGVTLTSSTVSGNSTTGTFADGGGVLSFGDVTLTSSTVTDNHADHSSATGGGIWNDNDTVVITNSIVADNSAGGGSPDIKPGTGTLTINHSLIGDTSGSGISAGTGTGNILNQSALLGPLQNDGGPTETHALLVGSPAIDTGDNALAVDPDGLPLTVDQRGFARVIDGDNDGTATVDIGAFEFVEFLLGDVDQNGVVNFLDIDPFIGVLSANAFQAEADINQDGAVTFLDIDPFIVLLSSPPTAAASAQLSAAPSESPEPSRQTSDGISVQLSDAPSSLSLPPSDVASTQLSAAPAESSLLTFIGVSQVQNGDGSRNFRNERPFWNGESVAKQLSHRKADRLAAQENFHDAGSRASSILDAFAEPAIATSSADLFDNHPEFFEGLAASQLDEVFEELLI